MKFAQKLSCAMVLLVAISFSAGGFFLVWGNFSDAFKTVTAQNERWHQMQCYALESEVLSLMARGESVTGEAMAAKAQALSGYSQSAEGEAPARIRLLADTGELFSSLSADMDGAVRGAPALDDTNYLLRRSGRGVYMLLSSSIAGPAGTYALQSVCDVSEVFAMRQSQLARLWGVEALALMLCAGAAWLLSRRLTAPLSALSAASERIAAGEYGVRTGVESADEIGALSRSFDAMAGAVERNVEALELSVRQRDDFMGAFSHELKTPMTAIIGYADTLRSMQCEPQTQKMAAGYIYSEAKRVEMLSRKMLALMGLSEAQPALIPVPLARVLRRVQTALAPALGAAELSCEGDTDALVLADEELLCDLVYNLAHNAAKAQPRDGRVRIRAQRAADEVRLCVSDTGCGIPAAQLARVTEPFYMVDKSRARRGRQRAGPDTGAAHRRGTRHKTDIRQQRGRGHNGLLCAAHRTGEGGGDMRERLQKLLSAPARAVLATGLAALALSTLPMLALRLTDLRLLEAPHRRTHAAVSLTPKGDDLYLVRALQKQSRASYVWEWPLKAGGSDASLYVQSEMSGLGVTEGRGMMEKYLAELAEAGALDGAWLAAVQKQMANPDCTYTYRGDTAGFISLYAYDGPAELYGSTGAHNFCSLTIENSTGRVVNLWIGVPAEPGLTARRTDVPAALERAVRYLGLAALGDWQAPSGLQYDADASLYSRKAQLLLSVSILPYVREDGTDTRQYLYAAKPLSAQTVDSWRTTWQMLYDDRMRT